MHPLDSVLDAIGACAGQACNSIGSVSLLPLTIALLAITAMEFARARAWQWILREAFPGLQIPYRVLAATHLIGGGLNAILPARAGEPVKVYLTKREVPGTTYGALASSLVTLTLFDLVLAAVGLVVAVQTDLLPTRVLPHVPLVWLALGIPALVGAVALAARALGTVEKDPLATARRRPRPRRADLLPALRRLLAAPRLDPPSRRHRPIPRGIPPALHADQRLPGDGRPVAGGSTALRP